MISRIFPELKGIPESMELFLDVFLLLLSALVVLIIVLNVFSVSIHILKMLIQKIRLSFAITKMWIRVLFSAKKKTPYSSMTLSSSELMTLCDLSEPTNPVQPSNQQPSTFPQKPLRGKDGRFVKKRGGESGE